MRVGLLLFPWLSPFGGPMSDRRSSSCYTLSSGKKILTIKVKGLGLVSYLLSPWDCSSGKTSIFL